MVKVIATVKGYFGSIVRNVGDSFALPDELWEDKKLRPKWVKLDPAVAFGGKGDHDGDGNVGGSLPGAGTGKASASAGAVDVPADWPNLHHAKRKALAKAISGAAVTDLDAADAIITAYVDANKPAPFGDAPEPQTVAQAIKAIGGIAPDWVDPNAPKAVAD